MNAHTEYNHVNFLSYRYKNKNNGTHVAKCRKPSLVPPNVMITCLGALAIVFNFALRHALRHDLALLQYNRVLA